MALGALGAGLNAGASQPKLLNQPPPSPVFGGLQNQALGALPGIGSAGFNSLNNLISTGSPVATDQYVNSLQQLNNLQNQQGMAQLREQFGASGTGGSTSAAVGESNFLSQSNASFLNSINALRYQSATDATNRQAAATQFGLQAFLGPAFTEYNSKIWSTGQSSVPGSIFSSLSGGDPLSILALMQGLGV